MNQKLAIKQLKKLMTLTKPQRLAAEEWKEEWQILIATLMSARTNDDVTIPVAEALFKKYPSPLKLSKAPLENIKKLVRKINYYNTKAKNIKKCATQLTKLGKVPHQMNQLLELAGVGRKTANVFLSEVGYPAIGVDTHVHRISLKLKWAKTDNSEKIEYELKKLFPEKYWNDVNKTLVNIGRTYKGKEDGILKKI